MLLRSHPSIEDMTDHYVRFAEAEGLPVLTHAEFTSLDGGPGDFTVGLRRTLPTLEPGQAGAVAEGAAPVQLRARRVVLATGRYVRTLHPPTPLELSGAPGPG